MLKMKQAIIAALPIAPIRSAINTGGMGIQGSFDECPRSPMSRPKKSPSGNNRSATSVHALGTPVMGIGLWGLCPLCEIGISRRSVYQMTASREQALGEGCCRRANELAHLCGTAAALLCVEPTRPDPHARWCGEGVRQRASLTDLFALIHHKRFF